MKRFLLAACLLTLSSAAMAAPSQGSKSKIHPLLQQYANRVPTLLSRAVKNSKENLVSTPTMRVNSSGEMAVYINVDSTDEATLTSLENAGVVVDKAVRQTVKAWVKPGALSKLADLDNVTSITPPRYAITRQQGDEVTEGDAILQADQVRDTLFFTGNGIKIGVLSDGVGGLAASVLSGDIPDGSDTTCVNSGSAVTCGRRGTGSEGTAMMEIIHDMAPDAELYFYGVDDSIDMIDGIDYLTNDAVVDIIVDDLGFPAEPFFEDGDVADEVLASIDAGVIYVSAAGNDAERHIQEEFDDTGAGDAHKFDGTDEDFFVFQIPASTNLQVILQWDDSNYEAPTHDLDLIMNIYSNAGLTTLVEADDGTGSQDNIAGASSVRYAFEGISYSNTSGSALYGKIVVSSTDATGVIFELIPYGANNLDYTTAEDSIYGHPALDEVISIGTINADEPGNDAIASYSSQGPATVSGVARNKPDITGIDKVSVTGHGSFGSPFSGTSAAAPHIAACAALMLEANDQLSHTQIKTLLEDNATDLGDVGFDFVFGNGLADCLTATTTADLTTGEGRTREAPAGGGGSAASCSFTPNSSLGSNWIYVLLVAGFIATIRGMKRKLVVTPA